MKAALKYQQKYYVIFPPKNIVIGIAHRTGQTFHNKHNIAKISSYEDKVNTMKKSKEALRGKKYYKTNDLTHVDFQERKKWLSSV